MAEPAPAEPTGALRAGGPAGSHGSRQERPPGVRDEPATGQPLNAQRSEPAGRAPTAHPASPPTGSAASSPGTTPAGTAGSSPSATGPQQAAQWKIQPLPGEPPLTLYRDKRIVVLPPGTEIDRYGEANGNVAYAARTPYRLRSLPPDWSNFPYHLYRLQRPIEALTGLAVPWFEQPGGGTAFVLPRSIAELMADGALVEVKEAAAPGS